MIAMTSQAIAMVKAVRGNYENRAENRNNNICRNPGIGCGVPLGATKAASEGLFV